MKFVILCVYFFSLAVFSFFVYGISAAIVLYKKKLKIDFEKFKHTALQNKLETQKDFFKIENNKNIFILITSNLNTYKKNDFADKSDYIILYTDDLEKYSSGFGTVKKLRKQIKFALKNYKTENIFIEAEELGCSSLSVLKHSRLIKKIPSENFKFSNPPVSYKEDLLYLVTLLHKHKSFFSYALTAGIHCTDYVMRFMLSRF